MGIEEKSTKMLCKITKKIIPTLMKGFFGAKLALKLGKISKN